MKNVMLIIQKLNGGGAERAVANLSKDLSKYYNVTLVVFDGSEISYPYCGKLIDLKLPAKKNKIKKLLYFLKRVRIVRKIKQKEEIYCSISFMPGANIVNVCSRQDDIIITSQRNMMSLIMKSRLSKHIISLVSKYSDATVVLSEGVKKDLVQNFTINSNHIIETIYNTCDREWFMGTTDEVESLIKNMDNRYKYIVTVGRLHHQKGQWHLIKAFSYVKKVNPNVKLIILGKGPLQSELKKLVVKLNLEDDIIFLGYLKYHHKLLEKCDLFVFPSLVEGLGNALLEAMACGLPIISTDCLSGPREIIAPNTDLNIQTIEIENCEYGILIPPFNYNPINVDDLNLSKEELNLSKAIVTLISNDELSRHYSNKSFQRIQDFSSQNITKQWINLIERLNRKE